MTEPQPVRTSEFTWYSRTATWFGAAMLLVQSVLGRSAGPVTLLAVLLLAFGSLCFLIGLAVDSQAPGTALLLGPAPDAPAGEAPPEVPPAVTRPDSIPVSTPAVEAESEPVPAPAAPTAKPEPLPSVESPAAAKPASSRPAPASGRRPKFRERAGRSETPKAAETAPVTDQTAASGPAPATEPVTAAPPSRAEPAPSGPASGVRTAVVAADTAAEEHCVKCGLPLEGGQLVATCPVCGRSQHAICWMENHFHCATPDCTGHGSLEAPDE